jgi:hypothetical protein
MDALFSDIGSKPQSVATSPIDDEALRELVSLTIHYLRESKKTDEQILEQMAKSDPYRTYWKVAEAMVRYELGETDSA